VSDREHWSHELTDDELMGAIVRELQYFVKNHDYLHTEKANRASMQQSCVHEMMTAWQTIDESLQSIIARHGGKE
jgi:hypothetical protein